MICFSLFFCNFSWIELPLVRCKEVIECPPIGDSGLTVTTWAVEIPSHEGG